MINCDDYLVAFLSPMLTNPTTLYKSLLIIDDDVEDQEIFMEALREVDPGIVCNTAISGEDAFRKLDGSAQAIPELIFLDLNMPKLNGKQVLREIKKSIKLQEIPVIMYSTSFAPRDIDEVKQLGAVYHLLKPSRFDDLCQALRHLLVQKWNSES